MNNQGRLGYLVNLIKGGIKMEDVTITITSPETVEQKIYWKLRDLSPERIRDFLLEVHELIMHSEGYYTDDECELEMIKIEEVKQKQLEEAWDTFTVKEQEFLQKLGIKLK